MLHNTSFLFLGLAWSLLLLGSFEVEAVTNTSRPSLARPTVYQHVTWLYTPSLDKSAAFVEGVLGFKMVLNQGPCRLFKTAPESYLGVCDSRPAPDAVPPVTYTIVVNDQVDAWYAYLAEQGPDKVLVTPPSYSETFNVYSTFFYDPDKEGLGYYRFELQQFLDPTWPQPSCGGLESVASPEMH